MPVLLLAHGAAAGHHLLIEGVLGAWWRLARAAASVRWCEPGGVEVELGCLGRDAAALQQTRRAGSPDCIAASTMRAAVFRAQRRFGAEARRLVQRSNRTSTVSSEVPASRFASSRQKFLDFGKEHGTFTIGSLTLLLACLGSAYGLGSSISVLYKERELRDAELAKRDTELGKERELRVSELGKERELRVSELAKERELRQKDTQLVSAKVAAEIRVRI